MGGRYSLRKVAWIVVWLLERELGGKVVFSHLI